VGAECDNAWSLLDGAIPIQVVAIQHVAIAYKAIRNPFELDIVLAKEEIA
jgi:hypothetical protein